MPVDYQLAKIYKIEPLNPDHESDVYIGSTCEPSLAHRMAGHRRNYKRWQEGKHNNLSSFKLFDKYSVENCNIFLIEEFPCETKDQLRQRECYYIKNIPCVNKNIPGRTKKQYYENNKEHIKQYRDDHKGYIKQYRDDHKEHIKETNKQYRDNHKEYYQTKFKCFCGGCYSRRDKSTHYKTKNTLIT